jgi:succinate-semialdehyde dehydrogenase/glutarate-semialdehyde dehydrogenase
MSKYIVTNPATGEAGAPFAQTTDAQISAAIEAAHNTHQGWSKTTTVAERSVLIEKVAQLHRDRREMLAETIVREMGKPYEQALG